MAFTLFARRFSFRFFAIVVFSLCLGWMSVGFARSAQAQETAPGICRFRCVSTAESSVLFNEAASCNEGCFSRCQSYCGTDGRGGCFAHSCGVAIIPSYAGCVADAFNVRSAAERRTFLSETNAIISSASTPGVMLTCQTVSSFDSARCVRRGCGGTQFCCVPATASGTVAPANPCLPAARTNIDQMRAAQGITEPASQWSCQRVCEESRRQSRCVVGGCSGDATSVCCAPTTGPTATPQNANLCTASATTTRRNAGLTTGIILPACTQSGNCTLDDIVATGASFANFLFGLSGALFLLIFVYGGFRYVMSAGDSKVVGEAKSMIVNATIGLVLMIMATTIVRFVQRTITTDVRSVGTASTCEQQFARQGFECQYVAGDSAAEINRNATDLGCQQPTRNLCNLQGQEQLRCCPLTESAGPPAARTGEFSFCYADSDCPAGHPCRGAVGTTTPGQCE